MLENQVQKRQEEVLGKHKETEYYAPSINRDGQLFRGGWLAQCKTNSR